MRESTQARARLAGAVAVAALLGAACGQAEVVATSGGVAQGADFPEVITPLVADVLGPLQPVLGADGQQHIAYELFVTNPASAPMALQQVDVLDAKAEDAVLASLSGDDLAEAIKPLAGQTALEIGPAQVSRVFVDVVMAADAVAPRRVEHRFTFTLGGEATDPVVSAPASVRREEAMVVGAPLRGANWLVAGGCCFPPSYHRQATLPVNGAFHAPERFAIDFVQLDDENRAFSGPADELSSYAYFGADVLSVADGTVVRLLDGLPEQVPGSFAPGATAETAGGNYVVIDIGDGHYAFYAHLQPGSLTVEVGDHVAKGEVLGLLGNTGNSDAPHLHFHIMDGPGPLSSNGLPYRFESFEGQGVVTNPDAIPAGTVATLSDQWAGGHDAEQLPLDWQLVTFPS